MAGHIKQSVTCPPTYMFAPAVVPSVRVLCLTLQESCKLNDQPATRGRTLGYCEHVSRTPAEATQPFELCWAPSAQPQEYRMSEACHTRAQQEGLRTRVRRSRFPPQLTTCAALVFLAVGCLAAHAALSADESGNSSLHRPCSLGDDSWVRPIQIRTPVLCRGHPQVRPTRSCSFWAPTCLAPRQVKPQCCRVASRGRWCRVLVFVCAKEAKGMCTVQHKGQVASLSWWGMLMWATLFPGGHKLRCERGCDIDDVLCWASSTWARSLLIALACTCTACRSKFGSSLDPKDAYLNKNEIYVGFCEPGWQALYRVPAKKDAAEYDTWKAGTNADNIFKYVHFGVSLPFLFPVPPLCSPFPVVCLKCVACACD